MYSTATEHDSCIGIWLLSTRGPKQDSSSCNYFTEPALSLSRSIVIVIHNVPRTTLVYKQVPVLLEPSHCFSIVTHFWEV